jgi:hypothetical protein
MLFWLVAKTAVLEPQSGQGIPSRRNLLGRLFGTVDFILELYGKGILTDSDKCNVMIILVGKIERNRKMPNCASGPVLNERKKHE